MDGKNFSGICAELIDETLENQGIGTLGEKILHRAVKRFYSPSKLCEEIKIGAFTADIMFEGQIIEIQTRGFDRLRKRLDEFLPGHRVTVVYPAAYDKTVIWLDPASGELSKKRRSPKKESVYGIIRELYRIKGYLNSPSLDFCVCLLRMEEYRYLNGWSADRKKGSSRCDRIPLEFLGEVSFGGEKGFGALLPEGLPGRFTSKDYQKAAGVTLSTAQRALNILCFTGTVKKTGSVKRFNIYERV